MINNNGLAFAINDALKIIGFPRNKSILDPAFFVFTPDELANIKSLKLTNVSSLAGIELLPNLTSLEIISQDVNDTLIDPENSVNQIMDFTPLENLTNLERLTIIRDNNLTHLNLKKLVNLQFLTLVNNPYLTKLENIENLSKLRFVIEYGNAILTPLDMTRYLKQTKDTAINIIDIYRYPHLVTTNGSTINELIKETNNKIMFAEKTAIYSCLVIEPYQAVELYNNSITIINDLNLKNKSNDEVISNIYQYVINNTTFDIEGLKKRFASFKKADFNYDNVPYDEQREYILLHSSCNACLKHKANCEGYVNFMRFLLSIMNIPSTNVYCTSKEYNLSAKKANHSILKIIHDGVSFYYDPSNESKNRSYNGYKKSYDESTLAYYFNPLEEYNNRKEVHDGCINIKEPFRR